MYLMFVIFGLVKMYKCLQKIKFKQKKIALTDTAQLQEIQVDSITNYNLPVGLI